MLVTLLVAVIVASIVYWIITLIPFPPGPFKNIVLAILGLIFLLWVLQATGVFGDGPWFGGHRLR
jgi:hypothetical protein